MPDYYSVGSSTAVLVRADTQNQKKITNAGGSTLYYKSASDVSSSSNDGSLTAGQSVTISAVNWIVSAGTTNIIQDDTPEVDFVDLGAAGIDPISAPHGFSNWQPVAATSGTDTAFASGTLFVSSVFLPVDKTVTGIGFLLGSVGGTDKVVVQLNSASGALLANSVLTANGTTAGTAANTQEIAFTSTYAAKGPGLFFVGVSANGATAKLRTVPAFTNAGILAGSVSQTAATPAAITAPTTFTADKAPIAYVY